MKKNKYLGGLEKGDIENEVIDIATDYDEESLLQVTPREGLRMLDNNQGNKLSGQMRKTALCLTPQAI